MAATYLDSSAIVKLVVQEPESAALRRYLRRRRPLISSALARAEVLRVLLQEGDSGIARGRAVLGRIVMIKVTDTILGAAGALMPSDLRSRDAILRASAQLIGSDLGQVVTYDQRMLAGAHQLALKATSPR
jgi:predicted nucleic acid-binding protein